MINSCADRESAFLTYKQTASLYFMGLVMVFTTISEASKVMISIVNCPSLMFGIKIIVQNMFEIRLIYYQSVQN